MLRNTFLAIMVDKKNHILPLTSQNGKNGEFIYQNRDQKERTSEEHVGNRILWALMLLSGVLIYGSYSVLVHLCEVDGKIPFSSASMNLMIEIMKIAISVSLFMPEVMKHGFEMPPLSFILPFIVPAVLYFINNNIAVYIQLQMDPTTYQVLSNMKIASTALLYRIIIKQGTKGSSLVRRKDEPMELSCQKWTSLAVLTLAGIFDSYGGFHSDGKRSASEIHISFLGLCMITLYCFISGLAGVYTEYILKRQYQASLHLQNILLYSFGIILNGCGFLIQTSHSRADGEVAVLDLFKGYSIYTWLIIISQALNGLIMSAVMKHASNITRLFVISCAMVVTTVLSILIFHLQLNIFFALAIVLVVIALYMNYRS